MMEFETFRFLAPAWLLLLPLLWWLTWLLSKYSLRQSMWDQLCDPQLLDNMKIENGENPGNRWLIWPLALILNLAVIAAAGPSWRQQAHPVMESASARIIVLDLSSAMLVQDIKPNRYTQALAATREELAAGVSNETTTQAGGRVRLAEPLAAEIAYDDFAKVDLRVARIDSAERVEGADKLLRLVVDIGGERRTVFAGIKAAYAPDQLIGRLTVVVANLAPRNMRFGTSEGMVLAAGPGGSELWLLSLDDGAKPGMRIK